MTTSIQQTSRLFIAIPLPAFLEEALQEFQEWLASYPEMKVIKNWVAPEKFHLTIHFLGDVSHHKIPHLEKAIQQLNISDLMPLSLTLKDIGTFETENLPTVIWAGIESTNVLTTIHQQLTQILEELDIEIDERAFTPHVTLAYIHANNEEKTAIKKRLERILVGEIGVWEAPQLQLISSLSTNAGAVYKVIA